MTRATPLPPPVHATATLSDLPPSIPLSNLKECQANAVPQFALEALVTPADPIAPEELAGTLGRLAGPAHKLLHTLWHCDVAGCRGGESEFREDGRARMALVCELGVRVLAQLIGRLAGGVGVRPAAPPGAVALPRKLFVPLTQQAGGAAAARQLPATFAVQLREPGFLRWETGAGASAGGRGGKPARGPKSPAPGKAPAEGPEGSRSSAQDTAGEREAGRNQRSPATRRAGPRARSPAPLSKRTRPNQPRGGSGGSPLAASSLGAESQTAGGDAGEGSPGLDALARLRAGASDGEESQSGPSSGGGDAGGQGGGADPHSAGASRRLRATPSTQSDQALRATPSEEQPASPGQENQDSPSGSGHATKRRGGCV